MQSGKRRSEPRVEWVPKTELGKLIKQNLITINDIFQHSLRIQEPEIVDHCLKLKEQVLAIKSVQKQTKAGQRTRMKAVVVVGDGTSHVGLGVKAAKDVATAIRGAINRAKMSIRPVKLGHWDMSHGVPHTVPVNSSGKCGSVTVRCIPAPKGTGIVASKIGEQIFLLAGVKDVYTFTKGMTSTAENTAKALIMALDKASNFFTPDMWDDKPIPQNPLSKHADVLKEMMDASLKLNN